MRNACLAHPRIHCGRERIDVNDACCAIRDAWRLIDLNYINCSTCMSDIRCNMCCRGSLRGRWVKGDRPGRTLSLSLCLLGTSPSADMCELWGRSLGCPLSLLTMSWTRSDAPTAWRWTTITPTQRNTT